MPANATSTAPPCPECRNLLCAPPRPFPLPGWHSTRRRRLPSPSRQLPHPVPIPGQRPLLFTLSHGGRTGESGLPGGHILQENKPFLTPSVSAHSAHSALCAYMPFNKTLGRPTHLERPQVLQSSHKRAIGVLLSKITCGLNMRCYIRMPGSLHRTCRAWTCLFSSTCPVPIT